MELGRKSTGRTVSFKSLEEDGFQSGAGTRQTHADLLRVRVLRLPALAQSRQQDRNLLTTAPPPFPFPFIQFVHCCTLAIPCPTVFTSELNAYPDAQVDSDWEAEVQERIRKYDAGLSVSIPSSQVFAGLDEKLK
jgi:hypothetical protein